MNHSIPETDHCEVEPCLCGCGLVRVTLFNKAGEPFARATYCGENAMRFADMVADTAQAAMDAGAHGPERRATH